MSGPFILVDIATRQPVTIGDTRDTIRPGDAARWQCMVLEITAPAFGQPFGRVTIQYSDGAKVTVRPSFIGCEFVPLENVQDNCNTTSQEK